MLVNGVLGGVGSLAAQLARWGGATVIGTVRRGTDLDRVDPAVVTHAVALDSGDPAAATAATPRRRGPDDRGRPVRQRRPGRRRRRERRHHRRVRHPLRPHRDPVLDILLNNVTLRLLGSDDFPAEAKRQAARDLTAAAAVDALTVDVGARFPLAGIAKAHDHIDAGGRGRVLIDIQ
ncbi:NADPH:quinone oxidoreductase [Streptomyces purpurascens]